MTLVWLAAAALLLGVGDGDDPPSSGVLGASLRGGIRSLGKSSPCTEVYIQSAHGLGHFRRLGHFLFSFEYSNKIQDRWIMCT